MSDQKKDPRDAEESAEPAFEEALKDLEEAVERLEGGNLPLSEALSTFEAGLKASNLCRARLESARQRVEVLVAESGGSFELTELDPEHEV